MTPEETARHHSERPGYELVDYAEVALPVFKIYVVASLLLHTPLAPIYEFVLRTLRLGIDDAAGVAECLGIPGAMVAEVLESLHQAEEIAFRADAAGGADRFVLTRKGERTTTALERVRPEQQTLPILFDGLLRRPIEPPALPLLSGKQPEDLGMREIPALPATRVEVPDIDLPTAARMLARERAGEGRRDLLAIKSIDRRMRLHMPAVALVFRQVEGDEVDLLFASESRLLDEHNHAFALAEGASKTRLMAEFARPELVGAGSFARKVASLARAVEPKPARSRRLSLAARPVAAEGTIQPLTALDHAPLLWDAIDTARERVLIMSPWVTAQVLDPKGVASLRKLLQRGVDLYVGYGIDEGSQKPVPDAVERLWGEFDNFRLIRFGDTHEKVLIKDADFVVLGSFNWLSFRGDPSRALRRERSYKVTDPAFVEKEFASLEARFRPKKRRNAAKE